MYCKVVVVAAVRVTSLTSAVLAGLAVILLFSSSTPAQGPAAPSKASVVDAVDSVVRARLALPLGPASISVMISRRGETLVQRAWGTAHVARNIPATEAMTYRLASVSKQFTAALILELVDRGKLSLRDTLARHLRVPRPEWNPITIEQLLNHTSGLQRDYRLNTILQLLVNPSTETRLAAAARDPLRSAPGTQHAYSNTGYMILGVLIEKLYGKRYADVVRDEIAHPLGLPSLGWCTAPERRETEAMGHWRSPKGVLEPATEPTDIALGDGGLCATAGDLGKWNQALHGGRVLSPVSYTAMITPRGAAVRDGYGFGIRSFRTPSGDRVLTHDGATITFVSENSWYPADALSITVFYNSSAGVGTSPLAAQLASIVRGRTPVVAPAAGAPAGLEGLTGFYEGRPGRGFTITLVGGTLYGEVTGNTQKRKLVLRSGTTYSIGEGLTMTFTVGVDGRATSMVYREGALERIFSKVR